MFVVSAPYFAVVPVAFQFVGLGESPVPPYISGFCGSASCSAHPPASDNRVSHTLTPSCPTLSLLSFFYPAVEEGRNAQNLHQYHAHFLTIVAYCLYSSCDMFLQ